MELITFYVFAAIAVVSSLLVVGQHKPMHSVILLIVSFGALSGLYVLLDAPFTAVTQIIIYAGAIMVLFLFVVMLLNAHNEEEVVGPVMFRRGMVIGALLSVALAGEVVWALSRLGVSGLRRRARHDSVDQLCRAHRECALHHARVRVRGDVDPHPGLDDRRGRARAEGTVTWSR